MIRGITYVFFACLIWGIIFIVPRFMPGFDSIEIALGRYAFYGLISLFILAYDRFQLLYKIDLSLWIKAFWLGLAGNILYYFALVVCIRDSGAALSALMLGVAPISIAWYGNWVSKENSFRNLIMPSIATAIGLILVNFPAFENSASEGTLMRYFIGVLSGFLALGLWTWYACSSKIILTRYSQVSSSEWSTVLGVATFVSVLLVVGCYLFINGDSPHLYHYWHWSGELQNFLLGSALLGIPCSWLGFYLWSKGCTYIPVTLGGQLLIFETLFGLCFVYILEERLPSFIEGFGMLFMLGGIGAAMLQFKAPRSAQKKPFLSP